MNAKIRKITYKDTIRRLATVLARIQPTPVEKVSWNIVFQNFQEIHITIIDYSKPFLV